MSVRSIGWTSALIALSITVLWGGNVVALKLGLATFPPFWSAFWRMLTGVTVVGLWARARKIPLRPSAQETGPLFALAAIFTVQITVLNIGVDWTSAAFGVVLLNAYPVFANLISHFFVPEDRLSLRRVMGLSLAFSGVCFVFLGEPQNVVAEKPLWGNVLVTASAFLLGSRIVYTQRLVQNIHPVRPVFWQMILCLPPFLVAGAIWEPPAIQPLSFEAIAAILYQGAVIAGLCFMVWTTLLQRHSPGALSMFAFTSPIFGVLASGWFFGEAITARLWFGLVAVTAGILLVTRQHRPAEPKPDVVAEEALR